MEKSKRGTKAKAGHSQDRPEATASLYSGGQGVVCQEDAKASCCTKDEGGPFEAAL